jgi:hypothetical protein
MVTGLTREWRANGTIGARRVAGLLLWTAWAVACSEVPASGPLCLDGTHNKDCIAVARLVLASSQDVGQGDTVAVPITGVPVGGSTQITLQLLNATSIATAAGLKVEGIVFTPLEDQPLAFSCQTEAGLDCKHLADVLIVPAGMTQGSQRVDHLPIRIAFQRQDAEPRKALVTLTVSGDPARKEIKFLLATTQGSPRLSVSATQIDFPFVQPGQAPGELPLTLRNAGDSPLTITGFSLEGDKTFAIGWQGQTYAKTIEFPTPLVLIPGGQLTATVRFTPDAPQKRQATVRFFSNDDQQPAGTAVLLVGNSLVPCVKLKPSALDFGQALLGEKRPAMTEVSNCGSAPLSLLSVAFGAGTPATFSLTPVAPIVLKPNGIQQVHVNWTPQSLPAVDAQGKPKHETGTLVVQTSAGPATATLDGVVVTSKCPIAVAKVQEGEEVAPQTELHLIGTGSHTAIGTAVAKYKWSIKEQPEGSQQLFVKAVSSADNLFVPNVVGEYEFCLQVWDGAGQSSCVPDCQKVLVIPDGCGVHVELTWNTPGDSDQTDSGPDMGADLDLHVASALANGPDQDCDGQADPWFNNPFDAFWFNPHPNWGSYDANVQDDPSLDLDDTDGAGPENMNLGCQMDESLSIGVHYWNDHGFGTSLATVRVFLGSAKILDIDKVALEPLDMWYVGKLKLPMGNGSTAPVQVCHQSGDACLAQKMPGNSKGGKMWQPAGDWCRTPCYEPMGMSGAAASPASCGP